MLEPFLPKPNSPKADLALYTGIIVLGTHQMVEAIARPLRHTIASKGPVPWEMSDKRKRWFALLRNGFSEYPEQLRDLDITNQRFIEHLNIRNVLVHGGPEIDYFASPISIRCSVDSSRKEYRRLYVQDWIKTANKHGLEHNLELARYRARNGWPFQISYDLDGLKDIASGTRKLLSDVKGLCSTFEILRVRERTARIMAGDYSDILPA